MFSQFYATTVLQTLIDQQTFISLWNDDPLFDGSGQELLAGGYTRQLVSLEIVDNTPDSVLLRNVTPVVYSTATVDLGAITHFGVHDALNGGNLLFSDPLTPAGQWSAGVVFAFNAEQLQTEISTSLAFLQTRLA